MNPIDLEIYWNRLIAIADEAKFIDFKRSAMWIGKERVFIDRR